MKEERKSRHRVIAKMEKTEKTGKTGLRLGTLALVAALLTGCGGSSASTSDRSSYNGAESAVATDDVYYNSGEEDYEYEEVDLDDYEDDVSDSGKNVASQDLDNTSAQSNRKLIRRVNLTAETTEFDVLIGKLTARVEKLGGYVEHSEIYGGGVSDSSSKSATLTIRIPSRSLDSFVDTVSDSSNVTRRTENVEDITLQYVDLESKKESLKVEQERLMALLGEADSIETIVALESRLTEVRYELQSMESKLRTYDNQVDYATVELTIHEVEIFTPEEPKGRWEELTTGFAANVKGAAGWLLDFVIGLILALPYLVVWGLVIAVFVLIIKKIVKHRKARREKKKAFKEERKKKSGDHGAEPSKKPDTWEERKKADMEADQKEQEQESEKGEI